MKKEDLTYKGYENKDGFNVPIFEMNFDEDAITDEKEYVTKPVLIPNKEIYRDGSSFFISAETIKQLHKNFYNQYFIKTSEGLDIIESWIIEDENDKSYAMGFDYPIGTWMVTIEANPDAVSGFSVGDIITVKNN